MACKTVVIPASQCFTIPAFYGNLTNGLLFAGFFKSTYYRSFLQFNIDEIPADAEIQNARLRLYLYELDSGCQSSCLYLLPMPGLQEPCTEPEDFSYDDELTAAVEVSRGYKGWLEADVSSALNGCMSDSMEEIGFFLTTDKTTRPFFHFAGSSGKSVLCSPQLTVNYVLHGQPETTAVSVLNVCENCWNFDFSGTDYSVAVNVERIKEGTFFVENEGDDTVNAAVEVSADKANWAEDNCRDIPAGRTVAIVAKYFAKYYRIKLFSAHRGRVSVKFICQRYN